MLQARNIVLSPTVVAQTGWTVDDLLDAIYLRPSLVQQTYDLAFILIGVNNQYRQYPFEWFERDLKGIVRLVKDDIGLPKGRICLLSIPNYGKYPAIPTETKAQVQEEIKRYNEYIAHYAKVQHLHFLDLTAFCQLAEQDRRYVAKDLLHPSGKMYYKWAEKMIKSDPLQSLIGKM